MEGPVPTDAIVTVVKCWYCGFKRKRSTEYISPPCPRCDARGFIPAEWIVPPK